MPLFRKNQPGLPPDVAGVCAAAIRLIGSTPLYEETSARLHLFPICYNPNLRDRAILSGRRICLGPEAIKDGPTSVAGTLVHEEWHTRQNPFLKTASFWRGVATRTHPMRLFEWPAYRRQIAFLKAVARVGLDPDALAEADRVLAAFVHHYGPPPENPRWGRG